MNYFEVLDLPVRYNINSKDLVENYLAKQKNSENESSSEALNEAYNVLKDDIRRAEYFLKFHEISIDNVSSNVSMEMFEVREIYENITRHEEQVEFQKNLKQKIQQMIISLNGYENDLKKFAEIFSVVKFMSSFLEKVRSDVYSRN